MKWVFYFLTSTFSALLIPGPVLAQIYNVTSTHNIHSSSDFSSQSNVIGSLPRGSKIKVLEVKSHPSGTQALRIEIMTSDTTPAEKNKLEPQWIIRRSNADYIEVTAEKPKAKILKTEVKMEDYCAECNNPAMKKNSNQKDLDKVTKSVEKDSGIRSDLREMVKNYSESLEVETTIAKAQKLYGRVKTAGLRCYHGVKEALRASPEGTKNSGLASRDISGRAAASAVDHLKEFEFVNLLDSEFYKSTIKNPSDAPKGSVLVYSSGKKCAKDKNNPKNPPILDCGHVEIKISDPGKPGYISDFYSPVPITDYTKYKLIGVMVKPMDGKK